MLSETSLLSLHLSALLPYSIFPGMLWASYSKTLGTSNCRLGKQLSPFSHSKEHLLFVESQAFLMGWWRHTRAYSHPAGSTGEGRWSQPLPLPPQNSACTRKTNFFTKNCFLPVCIVRYCPTQSKMRKLLSEISSSLSLKDVWYRSVKQLSNEHQGNE